MQSTPDEVLIGRIANGDRLAMQVLYARHHVRVFRFVVRTSTPPSALRTDQPGGAMANIQEDLISEVFLDVWAPWPHPERAVSVTTTWLLALARNPTMTTCRKAGHIRPRAHRRNQAPAR
jgi:RNA polymerase sigma-70 factor (ECF subfamily)